MAEDASDRIPVIPWVPPSPYRRREIIQGEGGRSAAMRPMRAEARALLIDALRDAHCWQDELIRDPSCTIALIAAREKKTEHSIRMTLSLSFLSHPSSRRRSRDGCPAALASSAQWTFRWVGRNNGPRSVSRRPHRLDRTSIGSTHHHPRRTCLESGAAFRYPTLVASRGGRASVASGNGILRLETRRRVQAQKTA